MAKGEEFKGHTKGLVFYVREEYKELLKQIREQKNHFINITKARRRKNPPADPGERGAK